MQMKKFISVFLTVALSASLLTACANKEESTDSDAGNTVVSEQNVEENVEENTDESVETDPFAELTFYESPTGISLYMSEGYVESSVEGITCVFEGENNAVSINEESFESLESVGISSDMTLDEYGRLLLDAYQLSGEVLTDDYGNTYIYYEKNIEGTDISYYGFLDKGNVAFWTTNFMCIAAEAEVYEENFKLWASSIQVP